MNDYLSLTAVFIVLFCLGYGLSLYLYKINGIAFHRSPLQLKIIMWLPIYMLFMLYMNLGLFSRLVITALVLTGILLDLFSHKRTNRFFAYVYGIGVMAGMISALYLYNANQLLLVAVVFSSVVSDVFAFFFGNFFGSHKLPKQLNSNKSWEGVFGQMIGAVFGIILINAFFASVPIVWAIVVGFASASGDLTNSAIKRLGRFKDWSNRLPGHGGYLDRFSSLSFVLLLTTLVIAF